LVTINLEFQGSYYLSLIPVRRQTPHNQTKDKQTYQE